MKRNFDLADVLLIASFVLSPLLQSMAVCGQESEIDFERDVAPVLLVRCVECHNSVDPSGALDLTSADSLLRGGDSGAVVDLEHPEESYLLQRVAAAEMPPESKGQSQQLPDDELAILKQWIATGAKWPAGRVLSLYEQTTDVRAGRDWWSLQPVVKPDVPKLSQGGQPDSPIDAFILTELQQSNLSPAPPAERDVLIRRLYYDLIGLPPTVAQVREFVNDKSPNAWEALIDSLLASPHYGERWARYWLDVTRYAETSGYERDQEKSFAWKYRDWVVEAFNSDMPYAQFVIEQIAGDEIEDCSEESVIATGFLRLGSWNDEPNDPLDYEYDRLEDLVHTTSSAFLALTVKCARCHAHKFDPILQEDYYRMASAFWPGPIAARDRKWLGGPTTDELGYEDVLGWTDLTPEPAALHVLKNGQRAHPMQEVVPASLSCIPMLEREFAPPPPRAKTTTRRLQLAQWIADPRHPLTARVLVNRLWQHHFGQAIVRTPNNFGFLADPPTHPQLLDWLAAEFLERGGSVKAIHKLILMSGTWQQASVHPHELEYSEIDPTNRLWWRAERRRLDAEALRDSMLAVSGELDLRVGGESFKTSIAAEALEGLSMKSSAWHASPLEEQNRRSLYMYIKRGLLPPFMTAFDLCDATQPAGKRDVTTVPTQALALLNNQFVHDRSEALASRIAAGTEKIEEQVRRAWLEVLQRPPTAPEIEWSMQHVVTQREHFEQQIAEGEAPADLLALASLCHVLLNSNEFLYMD